MISQLKYETAQSIFHNFKYMGTTDSVLKAQNTTTFAWKTIEHKRRNIPGTPSLCKDEAQSLEADCYDVALRCTLEQQMKSLLTRRNFNDSYVPQLFDVREKEKQLFDCNMSQRLQIYTQKIICRLTEVDFSKRQALYLLKEVIEACRKLHRYTNNFFNLVPNMIGFNSSGEVKVWLHENFGKSEIQLDSLARTEYEMLISIVRCFETFEIRVQNYYGYCKFQQIISHLRREIDPLQLPQLKKTIINRVTKFQRNKNEQKQNEMVQGQKGVIMPGTTYESSTNYPRVQNNNLDLYQQSSLKQNVNPFKKGQRPHSRNEFVCSDEPSDKIQHQKIELHRPNSALSQKKHSLKYLNSSSYPSAVKFVNLNSSFDMATLHQKSLQMSRNTTSSSSKNISMSSGEYADHGLSQKINLKRRSLAKIASLHRGTQSMSRITERSNEEDMNSYLNNSSVSRQSMATFHEDQRREEVNSIVISQQKFTSSMSTPSNYFTRIEL